MEQGNHYKPTTSWSEKTHSQEKHLIENALFFTIVRQQGANSPTLTFILKDQTYHTLTTADIEEIYYEPSKGIIVFFRFGIAHIKGRNLLHLHQLLREGKVCEIREFSENADVFFDKEALFINNITYQSDNLERWEAI